VECRRREKIFARGRGSTDEVAAGWRYKLNDIILLGCAAIWSMYGATKAAGGFDRPPGSQNRGSAITPSDLTSTWTSADACRLLPVASAPSGFVGLRPVVAPNDEVHLQEFHHDR
jgi:hypothetical protein